MTRKILHYAGIVVLLLSVSLLSTAQSEVALSVRQAKLQALAEKFRKRAETDKQQAIGIARQLGIPLRQELPNGRVLELQRFVPGRGPLFYTTYNLDAADTTSTDEVWPGGAASLSLEGNGMTVGEWDSGAVLAGHPDLFDRVNQVDGVTGISNHSTHVAGTLIGAGIALLPDARGMAPAAELDAYDWNLDATEMASAALAGLLVSNHSYGIAAGWIYLGGSPPNNWWWIGGPGLEDPNFGYYDTQSQEWDQIAFNAPNYLIVKAAGNDRWDTGPAPGELYTIVDQDGEFLSTSTASRPADCAPSGYDCLPTVSVAKNILTVGAVDDVPGGYQPLAGPGAVQMTGFSGWGPTDDGRIKPDLVANGWLLMSTYGEDPYYAAALGTSMAAPNVSGSLILLQEHYQNIHGSSNFMRAATLKALAIHSADETGDANGPDYEYGWGLLNTRTAARVISEDGGGDHQIIEGTLAQSGTNTVPITVSQNDATVRITLVWMDPAGTPPAPSLDPTESMLVNDLDLRVTDGSSTYMPWVLNPAAPGNAATTGDNTRDNVEQVVIYGAPSGSYSVEINHKGSLLGGSQDYSLIVSILPPPPVSSGLLIDEDFSGGLPPGWSVDTKKGRSWTFRAPIPGDERYDNHTGGTGNFAMVDNIYANSRTYLRLPAYDMSSVTAVVLRFSSSFPYYDTFESLNVDVSYNGGANWTEVWSFMGFNPFPTRYTLDLSGSVAGQPDVVVAFRWDSENWSSGDRWQIDDVELEVFGGVPPPPPLPPPPVENPPGQAENPTPIPGEFDLLLSTALSWTPGQAATSHDVYFGTNSILGVGDFQVNQTGMAYAPGALNHETTYYWRVDAVNTDGITEGVTWSFTTTAAPPPVLPGPASSPAPAHTATGVSITPALSWTAGTATLSHDVYFGTDSTPDAGESQGNQPGASFNPGTLAHDTTYYWRIDEVNLDGTTAGAVWSFTTEQAPVPASMHVGDLDGVRNEQRRSRWQAVATILVHDHNAQALANATVSGAWSSGASGSDSCITNGQGLCSISKNSLKAGVTSVTFTVTSITHAGAYTYTPADNGDPDGETNGTSITIPTSSSGGGNEAPSVSISLPTGGSSFPVSSAVEFTGSASDPEDGNLTGTIQWSSSLDGVIGGGGNFTTSSLSVGSHLVTATVSDSGAEEGTDTVSITITSGTPTTLDGHVGALSGSSASAPKNRWSASVTISAHDAAHAPLHNVDITGTWSNGTNGSATCNTLGSGGCEVNKNSLKGNVGSVTFTITNITGTGVTYQPTADHQSVTNIARP